ncbi:MAG: pyrroline-5-carboxylate reductase [Candidatus Bathyarchaeia archaeon]|nr:pyrroline-5-carboxylate reductase [Candidatus Bathyarchaeota archaeon]
MNIAVIGGGVIGEAVARNLAKAGYNIIVTEKRSERIRELERIGLRVTSNNRLAARQADIIFICVKPKDVKGVLEEIREDAENKIIISVAAAVSLSFLRKLAPKSKIIRTMPNLALIVSESFIAYSPSPDLSQEDVEVAVKILSVLGKPYMIDESHMDAITALSGCAPAYLALIAEALTYAGLYAGLDRELSLKIAAQAMIGTGKLILEGGKTPSQIRDMVVTPGGVTISGLLELEGFPIRHAFIKAVKAATEKSIEISSQISSEG